MKIINTKLRGLIDYTSGIAMILTPWIGNFTSNTMASYLLIITGIITVIHSLATDYEFGIVNQIGMKKHIKIDMLLGILIVLLPMILNLNIYIPHLIFGTIKLVAGILTQNNPSYKGYQGYNYKKFEDSYNKFEKFPSMKY
ncbi:MAG: SPW repeat protein [Bacteroidia bacterium]|nr:SPW repeat protein [Bacteroidia bacterium]